MTSNDGNAIPLAMPSIKFKFVAAATLLFLLVSNCYSLPQVISYINTGQSQNFPVTTSGSLKIKGYSAYVFLFYIHQMELLQG